MTITKSVYFFLYFFSLNILVAQIDVSVPDITSKPNTKINIPVYVSDLSNYGIRSYTFHLEYDQKILELHSLVINGTLSGGWFWRANADKFDGGLEVSANGWRPLSGSGTLIILKFDVIADEGSTDLLLNNFIFNNGKPNASLQNGKFTVYKELNINFSKSGNGNGSISVDGKEYNLPFEKTFVQGNSYDVKAIPESTSIFKGWSGGIQSNSNQITFTAENKTEIFVNFSLITFTISALVEPEGYGNVEGVGVYFVNDLAQLTANSYSGKQFINWTIDSQVISVDETYKFNVNNDVSLTANFKRLLYQIIVNSNPIEGGQVSGAGYYYLNEEAKLTANTNEGWKFMNWVEYGEIISEDSVIFISVFSDRSLTANYSLVTNISENENEKSKNDANLLLSPYPNPFNPTTTFSFEIIKPSKVSLYIYDISGKLSAVILDSKNLSNGTYNKKFNASHLSSGVYFYHFTSNDNSNKLLSKSGKLILVK